jgi:hypothetical protein
VNENLQRLLNLADKSTPGASLDDIELARHEDGIRMTLNFKSGSSITMHMPANIALKVATTIMGLLSNEAVS